jgi:archaeal flagellin FlaB
MFSSFHKDESGQTALETAIILIAFVVVASVFAFTILSAGNASTERGEQAVYSGLENVQSSMSIKGAVIAQGTGTQVDEVIFTVAPVSGGQPVNLNATDKVVVIDYRDATQRTANVAWEVNWIVSLEGATPDDLLEEGELAEITVHLSGASASPAITTPLSINTPFTLELKPPTGAVIAVNRTTPAAIETVMELR